MEVICPSCQKRLRLKSTPTRKRIKCPACDEIIPIAAGPVEADSQPASGGRRNSGRKPAAKRKPRSRSKQPSGKSKRPAKSGNIKLVVGIITGAAALLIGVGVFIWATSGGGGGDIAGPNTDPGAPIAPANPDGNGPTGDQMPAGARVASGGGGTSNPDVEAARAQIDARRAEQEQRFKQAQERARAKSGNSGFVKADTSWMNEPYDVLYIKVAANTPAQHKVAISTFVTISRKIETALDNLGQGADASSDLQQAGA